MIHPVYIFKNSGKPKKKERKPRKKTHRAIVILISKDKVLKIVVIGFDFKNLLQKPHISLIEIALDCNYDYYQISVGLIPTSRFGENFNNQH